ncbi:septum formation inhibitor Maf [Litoribaculum gwangyangense]
MLHKFVILKTKPMLLKRLHTKTLSFLAFISMLAVLMACKNDSKELAYNSENKVEPLKTKETPSPEFKAYWYGGEAEITSYKLEQARYGEIREGKAVLVYVTEDFLPEKQVKSDTKNPSTIPVLKLNATKNFLTGIYPYSIMQSTFYPIYNNAHAVKVSASVQEWCGHVYTQLNNKEQFEVTSHSYFESEADEHFSLEKTILENELWVQLRVNPQSLPTGTINVIPSFEFTRLRHVPIKAYSAVAVLEGNIYKIEYPELNRSLTIQFHPNFPYDILEWEESFNSGFGNSAKILTTKATKLQTIKSAYWQKNGNEDEILRETLQLN